VVLVYHVLDSMTISDGFGCVVFRYVFVYVRFERICQIWIFLGVCLCVLLCVYFAAKSLGMNIANFVVCVSVYVCVC